MPIFLQVGPSPRSIPGSDGVGVFAGWFSILSMHLPQSSGAQQLDATNAPALGREIQLITQDGNMALLFQPATDGTAFTMQLAATKGTPTNTDQILLSMTGAVISDYSISNDKNLKPLLQFSINFGGVDFYYGSAAVKQLLGNTADVLQQFLQLVESVIPNPFRKVR
jgi:hypothetical protein